VPIEKVLFGAGCFWGVQSSFNFVKGVLSTRAGYSGGSKGNANYHDVSSGRTTHVEVVEVVYDSDIVPFTFLLELFFFIHDPGQLNRQGNDIGYQYRSVLFYSTDEQQKLSEKKINQLKRRQDADKKIYTDLRRLQEFYEAEQYHQEYLKKNANGYCHIRMDTVQQFITSFGYFRNS